jgi:hypothetical protein
MESDRQRRLKEVLKYTNAAEALAARGRNLDFETATTAGNSAN